MIRARSRGCVGPAWWIVPGVGNDGNNGRTRATAFASDAPVRTLMGNGTIPQGTLAGSGSALASSTATRAGYGAATVRSFAFLGGQIILDTTTAPLAMTAALTLGGRALRSHLPNTYGKITWNRALPNSGWTNTSGNIWKLAAGGTTYYRAFVWEAGVQMTNVIAANVATATGAGGSNLQANAGSCYSDPVNGDLYIHPAANGNPNSDGIAREYGPDLNNGIDSFLIDGTGGVFQDIWSDGGATLDPTMGATGAASSLITQAIGASGFSSVTLMNRVKATRWAKHGLELAANQQTGIFILNAGVTDGGRSGVFAGAFSGYVTYSGAAGAGTGTTYLSNCIDNGSGMISHNAGGVNQIAQQAFVNNTFAILSFTEGETLVGIVTNCTISSAAAFAAGTTVLTGNTIKGILPILGNTVTSGGGNTFLPNNTAFASTPSTISGTITFQATDKFLLPAGTVFAAAWIRNGAYSLTLNGTTLIARPNTSYGLIDVYTLGTDTISMVGAQILAGGIWPLVHNYNGTAVVRTYNQAVTDGWLSGCTFLDIFQGDPGTALLYQDAARTIPAVAHGDPVDTELDVRDTAGNLGYFYRRYTNVTLDITNGRKTLAGNGTTSDGADYAAGVPVDLLLAGGAFSYFVAVTPTGTPSAYDCVAATELAIGGFNLRLRMSGGAQWGTYDGSDRMSGTTLVSGTRYVLGMATAAGNAGVFYTNGIADGTFPNTGGTSASAAFRIEMFDANGIQRGHFKLGQTRLAGIQYSAGQAAAAVAAMP